MALINSGTMHLAVLVLLAGIGHFQSRSGFAMAEMEKTGLNPPSKENIADLPTEEKLLKIVSLKDLENVVTDEAFLEPIKSLDDKTQKQLDKLILDAEKMTLHISNTIKILEPIERLLPMVQNKYKDIVEIYLKWAEAIMSYFQRLEPSCENFVSLIRDEVTAPKEPDDHMKETFQRILKNVLFNEEAVHEDEDVDIEKEEPLSFITSEPSVKEVLENELIKSYGSHVYVSVNDLLSKIIDTSQNCGVKKAETTQVLEMSHLLKELPKLLKEMSKMVKRVEQLEKIAEIGPASLVNFDINAVSETLVILEAIHTEAANLKCSDSI